MMPFNITSARSVEEISEAKRLFVAYAGTLNIDLAFQNFQSELDALPGSYAPPTGEIFLAWHSTNDNQIPRIPIGCVAVRPLRLPMGKSSDECCEMKRLYVAPSGRGTGVGRELAVRAIDVARELGYRLIKLDTLASMEAARKLYAKLGFVECERYYDTPIDGTIFMSKSL